MRLNNNDIGITLPCGILEPHVKTTTTSVQGDVNLSSSSFYNIVLDSPYADKPLYTVCCNTMTCNL